MPLKLVIDDLVQVPGPLREEYKKGTDGKFHLDVEEIPDSAKVAEFRDKNVALLKEVEELRPLKTKYQGIDPEAARVALAKSTDTAKLAADLAAEKAAHAATQLRHTIVSKFLYVGGRASAVDFMAERGAKVFAMEDGKLTTKEFSASNPAEPLSVDEWMKQQIAVADFAFQPSRGGGAGGSGGSSTTKFGARSDQKILKNPTAQDLGANASDIASGKTKVEYT
jgi:hypothetical protein